MKSNILLFLIFFLALTLRLYQLNSLPHGFYEEEVTNAYVGRFILENGRDLYGNWFPLLYFDKFGDFPPVLPMYLSGLSTYIFGLTEFAARFPTAFIGALAVFPIFGFSQFFFKDKRVSLLASLLLAIMPWHVVLSRTSAEGIIGFTVFVWALVLLFQKKRLAYLLFFLCYFLYPGLRIIIPITLLPFYKKYMKATVFFCLLTVIIALTPWGKGRFEQTSLFHSSEVRERIAANMEALSFGEGKDNITLARSFHNKVVGYTREFVSQYISYFSPQYLFVAAGGQARYFNVPFHGLLFITVGVLILASFLGGVPGYIVYLLLITPIPAVLTVDFVPHAHRSLFLLFPLILFAALGFSKVKRIKFITGITLIFLSLEFVYFWHQYSRHEAANQSVLRNVGDKELVQYVIAHKSEYDHIIMPPFARLPIYYLYFSGNFDSKLIGKFKSQLQMDSLPGIDFFSDWCPTKLLERSAILPNTLIVNGGDCPVPVGYRDIHAIDRSDSTRAYRFVVPE